MTRLHDAYTSEANKKVRGVSFPNRRKLRSPHLSKIMIFFLAMIYLPPSPGGWVFVANAFVSPTRVSRNDGYTCRGIRGLKGRKASQLPRIQNNNQQKKNVLQFGYREMKSFRTTRSLILHSSKDDEEEPDNDQFLSGVVLSSKNIFASFSSLMVLWLPLFAVWGIPSLVSYARSFTPNSPEQYAAVTLLIVSNRVYLYALAITVVGIVAVRGASSGDSDALGLRLTTLTEEVLVFERPLSLNTDLSLTTTQTTSLDVDETDASATASTVDTSPPPSFVRKMVDDSGLEENLDEVDSGTLAVIIPVLVSGLLAFSVISLPFWSSPDLLPSNDNTDNQFLRQLEALTKTFAPLFGQLWNGALLTLFTRAELRRLAYELFGRGGVENGKQIDETNGVGSTVPALQIAAEMVVAIFITAYGAYYLQFWPACNFVNMAIAIIVGRVIRLNTLRSVAGALALLTLYDGASVYLIPAANAASIFVSDATTSASAASASAMGSVAVQKLSSAGFQPGLLVTKLDGDKLTGTLGLGDAVFPSILASFLKRFDDERNSFVSNVDDAEGFRRSSLFEASLLGYAIGCLACEFAPTISSAGVPALVFLLPSMVLTTVLAAFSNGTFGALCKYNEDDTGGNTRLGK